MSMKFSGGDDKQVEIVPAGMHLGVCYLCCDLGTQMVRKFQSTEMEPKRQVVIGWELPALRMDYKGEDKPRAISKIFTASMFKKANLRKYLECWRGEAMTDEEANQFDLKDILTKGAQIQVMHRKSEATGKEYANITAITPVMKGTEIPEPENLPQYFSLTEDVPIPDNVPNWIVEKIEASAEYKSGFADGPPDHTEPPADNSFDDCDDELPF